MGKLSKKVGRKKQLEDKKVAEENLAATVAMFDKRPDACTFCSAPFDKTSRDVANTWKVTVQPLKKRVIMYCPDCFDKVQDGLDKVIGDANDEE
jgi:uncharacterized protein with PIN domain